MENENKIETPVDNAKVETPVEKQVEKPAEINWQERATQAEEKLKGVDLDKWAKVKDLDPDEVGEAMKAYGIISEDEGKFKKVMEILEAKEEIKKEEAKGGDTSAMEKKMASAFFHRGIAKSKTGDLPGRMADFRFQSRNKSFFSRLQLPDPGRRLIPALF